MILEMSPEAQRVLNIIQNAPQPPKRKQIAALAGCSERTVTDAVHELRVKHRIPVLVQKSGQGFFISHDPTVIEECTRSYKGQALEMLNVVSVLHEIAKGTNQVELGI